MTWVFEDGVGDDGVGEGEDDGVGEFGGGGVGLFAKWIGVRNSGVGVRDGGPGVIDRGAERRGESSELARRLACDLSEIGTGMREGAAMPSRLRNEYRDRSAECDQG